MILSSGNFPSRKPTSLMNKRQLLDHEPLRDAGFINQHFQTYTLTGSNQTSVQLGTTQISSWLDEDQGIKTAISQHKTHWENHNV